MISRRAIDTFKCALCKNGLSIFPVHSYGNTDMVTCGRCSLQNDFLPHREHLYERLAEHIEFPCRYERNGCIERLTPHELQYHENSCPHKPCLCPILPLGNCQWEGDYKELYEHCENEHSCLAYKNFLVEIALVNSYEENYVFSQANETFVAQLKSDNDNHRFHYNVRYCGLGSAATNFSYRICFLGKKKKYCCSVRPVQPGEIGPIMCGNTTTVDFLDILENLDFPICITCKIDIFVKKDALEEPEEVAPPKQDEVLRKLECPICLEYMVPPIMQCNAGHSFCQPCHSKVNCCPTCKGPISETRNYLLEDITNIVSYPCKYKKYGCKFYANGESVKDHEANCINGPYKCIMDDCHWEDRHAKFLTHLKEAHKDNILESNEVNYIIDSSVDQESYNYIFILHDNVFKVEFSRDREEFWWMLQSVEHNKEDSSKVMLVLDFNAPTKERLYIQRKHISHPLFLQLEHLSEFIEDGVLKYKMQLIQTA